MWFGDLAPKANQNYPEMSHILETFFHGGYYRYDLDLLDKDYKVSVISLNTIYFHVRNREDPREAWRQLDWLE
jgi:hypothetical protein